MGRTVSQPARMRCGKEPCLHHSFVATCRNPHECAVAKVKSILTESVIECRNPHECAVAKNEHYINPALTNAVATRTNALWQRHLHGAAQPVVAGSQPARMRCGKAARRKGVNSDEASQPARMRCGKDK